ncbi:hypothetical protein QBC44DRAFT_336479 [Cladorrhinum sp. PSN332]|nr:hypothetical protein QBC44DRAFT_336479 [Cladorrhinum sp. PSN332]
MIIGWVYLNQLGEWMFSILKARYMTVIYGMGSILWSLGNKPVTWDLGFYYCGLDTLVGWSFFGKYGVWVVHRRETRTSFSVLAHFFFITDYLA